MAHTEPTSGDGTSGAGPGIDDAPDADRLRHAGAGSAGPSGVAGPSPAGRDVLQCIDAADVSVHVSAADVTQLSDHGLRLRLAEVGRAESRLAAIRAAALSEIARREGAAHAAHAAAEALSVSGRAARRDVAAAVALDELDATRSGLVSGALPAGHARLIARAAQDATINEQFLAERAQQEGHDAFRRTVERHVADRSGDDGASLLDRQRHKRAAGVFTSPETGMTVVNGQFDPITGARIAAAVDAAAGRLFRDEAPGARLTPAQRTADAITQLLCDPDTARPAGTSLMLVADYDTVNQQIANARLANGTPVPISEIAKIAVDVGVLPAIFDKATGELRMGRRRRSATELQRSALAVRDQGCVGCGAAPELCRAHHIVEWRHGGKTDLDNLVSVCHHCHHHSIHQDGFTVERDSATGHYRLQPPTKPPASRQPTATAPATEHTSSAEPSADRSPAHWQSAKRMSVRPPPRLSQPPNKQRAAVPSPVTPSSAKQPSIKPPPSSKRLSREPPKQPVADTNTTTVTVTRAPLQ
ncbi:HNH endonuclease [Candidatus Poriferisodalis sp.]|uniref:HNH endonuclease n=1 Tax=Candidatus Poriferisodalis sp. TaxID=3101277 RepID=UPI003B0183CC